MKRATSAADFAGDPIDRYWLSHTQLVWCRSPSLCGSLHWGQLDERDVLELTAALELTRHPALARGFDVFMDASGIERVDWAPFTHLAQYVQRRLGDWSNRIRRQAVVVPTGPAGPLLAGMVPMIGMTYPMRFFPDAAAALDWLDGPDRPLLADAIEEARKHADEARRITPTVHHLRRWLEGSLVAPTLAAAAAALGLSTRSLQRELKDAATSFTAEAQAARVRVACAMLVESDEKIEVVARAVGCVSGSQLSMLFRKHVGETPARYRERLAQARTGRT